MHSNWDPTPPYNPYCHRHTIRIAIVIPSLVPSPSNVTANYNSPTAIQTHTLPNGGLIAIYAGLSPPPLNLSPLSLILVEDVCFGKCRQDEGILVSLVVYHNKWTKKINRLETHLLHYGGDGSGVYRLASTLLKSMYPPLDNIGEGEAL